MGSKDRKQISHLCYCYFRTGKAMMNEPVEEKILASLFLCSANPNELLEALRPEWNEKANWSTEQKLSLLNSTSKEEIFPFTDDLSKNINKDEFIISHLQQPDLFLRSRPGKEETVKIKLNEAGVSFRTVSPACLALPNASKLDEVIEVDKEVIVQDYSSQQVGIFAQSEIANLKSDIHLWDCCAASGGKSIHLYDLYPGIDITVSDIRESILSNLKKRFASAGIKKYQSFIADLTKPPTFNFQLPTYNLILADLPCTGSGTWGRTPEHLVYFEEKKIAEYTSLQQKIIRTIIPQLATGGYLLYSTCSVFAKENEMMVAFITGNFPLSLIKMKTTHGYRYKADTMFMALLKKTSDQ